MSAGSRQPTPVPDEPVPAADPNEVDRPGAPPNRLFPDPPPPDSMPAPA